MKAYTYNDLLISIQNYSSLVGDKAYSESMKEMYQKMDDADPKTLSNADLMCLFDELDAREADLKD